MGLKHKDRKRRKAERAARDREFRPGSKRTFTLKKELLAPPGIPGDILVVACDRPEESARLISDVEERDIEICCVFSKDSGLARDISGEANPARGDSFFRSTRKMAAAMTVDAGGCRFLLHTNSAGEFSGVSTTVRAPSVQDARHRALVALVPMLDHWSYIANTPLVLRTVVCRDLKNNVLVFNYTTPYSDVHLHLGNNVLHPALLPIYGLYREAKNSASPFYRFLCCYKILEAIYCHLRPELFNLARERKITLTREKETVPDHPELQKFWPTYIGTPIKKLVDNEFQKEYRDAAAHFLLKDGRPLNPSDPEVSAKFDNMLLLVEVCCRLVIEQQERYHAELETGSKAATGT